MGGQVPLGYAADGRKLKINDSEAKTVRALYDLYEQHGTVRDVKAAADQRGLFDGYVRSALSGHTHNPLK